MRYDGTLENSKLEYDHTNPSDYEVIQNGSTIRIWDEWGEGLPNTELMPSNFWVNSIGLAEYGIENGFSIPIFWGKEKNAQNITKYRVYRAITTSINPPADQYFSWIADVDEDVFHFNDNSLKQINNNNDYFFHYYIESFSGSTSKNKTIKKTLFGAAANWSGTLLLSSSGNNPKIVWGPHPTMSVSNYKIYRAVTSYGSPPPTRFQYSEICSVSANTFQFVDYDFNIGGASNTAYWYVKAYNGSLSPETNIVNSAVLYYDRKQSDRSVYSAKPISEFKIYSNYPNPFNPVTTISFELPEDAFTQLNIYDIHGKEISTLVKDNFEKGSHSIQFDAGSLPSGIYFYRLLAVENKNGKSNSATGRMLLLK
ncbi:MAG: T9SS type A sorting domain-containing protein [Calditrichae bacterium]|nr:T9SS type A sorting domain-containing protein [Calditrichia bacterium]